MGDENVRKLRVTTWRLLAASYIVEITGPFKLTGSPDKH
jgi:hypothetical protein